MKKLEIVCLTFFIFFLSGCANIHSGNHAVQVDRENPQTDETHIKPTGSEEPTSKLDGGQKAKKSKSDLIISGEINKALSSRYFAFFNFTFENNSSEWIRIEDIEVDFGNQRINENISFTYGKDLAVWLKSTQKRNEIKDYNRKVTMGAIAGLGAGMSAVSNDENLQNLGLMTAVAGATALSAHKFNKLKPKVQNADIFPENHLFAKDFIVPPGLFEKKWIVVNSKEHEKIGRLTTLTLEYTTKKNETEKVKLQFRPECPTHKSVWQDDLPNPCRDEFGGYTH